MFLSCTAILEWLQPALFPLSNIMSSLVMHITMSKINFSKIAKFTVIMACRHIHYGQHVINLNHLTRKAKGSSPIFGDRHLAKFIFAISYYEEYWKRRQSRFEQSQTDETVWLNRNTMFMLLPCSGIANTHNEFV